MASTQDMTRSGNLALFLICSCYTLTPFNLTSTIKDITPMLVFWSSAIELIFFFLIVVLCIYKSKISFSVLLMAFKPAILLFDLSHLFYYNIFVIMK